jgi:hypothetical protein
MYRNCQMILKLQKIVDDYTHENMKNMKNMNNIEINFSFYTTPVFLCILYDENAMECLLPLLPL